jgi:hypothetical protein
MTTMRGDSTEQVECTAKRYDRLRRKAYASQLDALPVIPTEVEESLTSFCFRRAECRKNVSDVSTPLDMTTMGGDSTEKIG